MVLADIHRRRDDLEVGAERLAGGEDVLADVREDGAGVGEINRDAIEIRPREIKERGGILAAGELQGRLLARLQHQKNAIEPAVRAEPPSPASALLPEVAACTPPW